MPPTRPTEKIDACQVAARPGEAGDKTKPDRVFGDGEDDGDRRGCRLGRQRHSRASERGDHSDLPANQIGRQLRQSIELILGPAVHDRHVLALDIAGLFQALAKSAQTVRVRVRRCGVEEPDHWHRRLLRARRERPRAAAPPSSVMNSRRLMPNMGLPPKGAAADHSSSGPPGGSRFAALRACGGMRSRSLGRPKWY